MLIDWFTVGAQAVNFIVLVWLLKHFLYKPILSAIDAREARISAELADADKQKSEAQRAREDFDAKNKKFGDDRDASMARAVLEVKTERERLLDEARKEAIDLLAKRRSSMQGESTLLIDQMMRLAAVEVYDIARKALDDLSSADLEGRISDVFVHRLGNLDSETKASLGAAINEPGAAAVVSSRFELPPKEQATIRQALNQTLHAEFPLRFETAPERPCGIELTVGGQRLSWSIGGYLKALEEKALAMIAAEPGPVAVVPRAVAS